MIYFICAVKTNLVVMFSYLSMTIGFGLVVGSCFRKSYAFDQRELSALEMASKLDTVRLMSLFFNVFAFLFQDYSSGNTDLWSKIGSCCNALFGLPCNSLWHCVIHATGIEIYCPFTNGRTLNQDHHQPASRLRKIEQGGTKAFSPCCRSGNTERRPIRYAREKTAWR